MKNPVNNHYAYCSRYYLQISKFLEFYSPDQLQVTSLEDLAENPQTELDKIIEHIGADSFQYGDEVHIHHHSSKQKLRPTDWGVCSSKTPDGYTAGFALRIQQ